MDTYFDKEKLTSLIDSVYRITGITISVYDKNFFLICSVSEPMCSFCDELRTHEELAGRCKLCDAKALKKCKETKLRYIYRCHMGLIEVATPIIYNDDILGFIMFGQLTNAADRNTIKYNARCAARELNFESETLLSRISSVRFCSDEYISSVSDIVKMAAGYIVLNKMLSYKEDVGKQIEKYVKANISEDLNVDKICKKFGICSTTLYNIAVKEFGCGIKEYIGKCKINLAKEMLAEKKTLSEVSENLGFSNINYFIRFFKSKTGMTPKQYRNI